MAEDAVLFEVVEGLPTLALNRPDKLNALTADMFAALDEILDTRLKDAACLHLTGRGRSFCAGHDLDDLAAGESREAEIFANRVIERIAELPMPVVASVRGHCFTGGLELVLAADVIVAAEGAQFADTHARWDLVPVWGLTQRLPRRVGTARAGELMFTGRRCGGREAAAIGLADHCVPDGELDAFVKDLCGTILSGSARSHRAIKRLLRDTEGMPLRHGLAWELLRSEGHGPDFRARLAALRK